MDIVLQLTNLSFGNGASGIACPTSLSESHRVQDVFRIDDLPNELLSTIFENLDLGQRTHPERVLTGVCKKWYSVAVHTPALWTTISVVPPGSIQLIKTYLSRSSGSPLDLYFETWSDEGIWKGPLKQRLAVLMRSSQRWRSLSLIGMDVRNTQLVLSRVNNLGYLPLLRHLTVHKKETGPEEFRHCFPYIASHPGPALTELGIAIAGGTSSFFNSLTHLTVDTENDYVVPSWTRFKLLLLSLPNLEFLKLQGDVVEFDFDEQDFEFTDCPYYGVVHIPTLRTLILQPHSLNQLHSILSGIFAPHLHRLMLFHPVDDEKPTYERDKFWDDPDTYLHDDSGDTRFPEVKILVLSNCTNPAFVHGTKFLRAFPSVEHILLVHHAVVAFCLMLSMEIESGSITTECLLAQLKSITIYHTTIEGRLIFPLAIKAWSTYSGLDSQLVEVES
ncbi:hypothetical protein DEU56DRAFT_865531 [Suillus clintonianus]|uniref:uncharacterized protein n=1 Tax=Suillus clintonianus TaxID=1904413 RepID=UPI001B881E7B|nr:uncharacterized protein DEU56DRAFT_865531 [Suillus clintonianus]KAG2119331.1 hypothetical protein DEU56DRAFT_865531 [Suillus clintonianus]